MPEDEEADWYRESALDKLRAFVVRYGEENRFEGATGQLVGCLMGVALGLLLAPIWLATVIGVRPVALLIGLVVALGVSAWLIARWQSGRPGR